MGRAAKAHCAVFFSLTEMPHKGEKNPHWLADLEILLGAVQTHEDITR